MSRSLPERLEQEEVLPLQPAEPAPEAGPRDRPLRVVGSPEAPPGRENGSTAISEPAERASASIDPRAIEVVRQARLWLPGRDEAMFDTFLGQAVQRMAPYTEADPAGILVSLLASLGVRLGPGPHVRAGDDRHPLLIWPLLIGHTSTGKKGTAWSAAKRLLTAADPDFLTTNMRSGLSSGEGIAALFADENEDPDQDPAAAALRAKARHAALPPGDRRLLVLEPEWAVVMARMKREGNSLSGMLRAAWEGGDLSTMNVTARVARDTHIGLLAHITPGEFAAKVSASDMAGGTYNRFLPTAVAMSQALPFTQGTPEELVTTLGGDLAARLETGASIPLLQLTPGAAQLWQEVYVDFIAEATATTGPVAQFVSRAAPTCLRLAGIHAALDGTPEIHTEHLNAAVALVRYSIASAQATFADGDATGPRLAAWIADAGAQGRTRDEIRSEFFGRHGSREQREAVLERLLDEGWITKTKRPRADGKPGRSKEVYIATDTETARGLRG